MKFNIKEYEVVTKNNGNAKEWTLCEYYGIHRRKPDRTPYYKGSDIELGYMNISVKTPTASLMSGSLCIGCKTFEGIWRRYRKNTHSDTFAVVTNDFDAFLMDINKFSKFVHKFGYRDRESKKNGGGIKIKFHSESKEMIEWFPKHCK